MTCIHDGDDASSVQKSHPFVFRAPQVPAKQVQGVHTNLAADAAVLVEQQQSASLRHGR